VAAFAEGVGFEVGRALPGGPTDGAIAVIVSSHGDDEPESIRAALDAGIGYIGLVASRTRGDAVLEAMDLTDAERARIHTPVGLDIGAETAAEIGLSIVADIVRAKHAGAAPAVRRDETTQQPKTAIDPVCGMSVVVLAGTPHLSVDGVDTWFCSSGCRDHYETQVG
jgi:xanthine dehydrogenase accessory factor